MRWEFFLSPVFICFRRCCFFFFHSHCCYSHFFRLNYYQFHWIPTDSILEETKKAKKKCRFNAHHMQINLFQECSQVAIFWRRVTKTWSIVVFCLFSKNNQSYPHCFFFISFWFNFFFYFEICLQCSASVSRSKSIYKNKQRQLERVALTAAQTLVHLIEYFVILFNKFKFNVKYYGVKTTILYLRCDEIIIIFFSNKARIRTLKIRFKNKNSHSIKTRSYFTHT